MPRIIDCTLREGAQAPNVVWDTEQSITIARALRSFGVDCIEVGHPSASQQEFDRVAAIVGVDIGLPILAHARAQQADILRVAQSGADWVGIFAGVNEISRQYKFNGRDVDDIIDMVRTSISYARSLGLKVRFTLEDTSRTTWPLQAKMYSAAVAAGANRICYADTVGILLPHEARAAIARIKALIRDVPVEVHFHNDRGLALANALEVAPMVDWISTSVNGIGERCGITDTLTMKINSEYEGGLAVDKDSIKKARELSILIDAYSRSTVCERQPIVGDHAFTHCADLHIKAIEKDVNAYCWIPDYPAQKTQRNVPVPLATYVNSRPKVISATELKYHRAGPGNRYLMLDERVAPNVKQYCIAREIERDCENYPSYVDVHTHRCDSLFLFLGDQPGKTGLRVMVQLGDKEFVLDSPASVFIPAGRPHTYSVLKGKGTFINHVLHQNYNDSLLHTDWIDEPAEDVADEVPDLMVGGV